ncbi:MAG: acylphosphatase [Methanomicrobiales archaeon]
MVVRAHVWISGRVQGVCFRNAVQGEAIQRGVSGWVRNLADGRVEAVSEGAPEGVEGVIAFCRHGPPAARVRDVAVQWEEPTGETGFSVLPTQ